MIELITFKVWSFHKLKNGITIAGWPLYSILSRRSGAGWVICLTCIKVWSITGYLFSTVSLQYQTFYRVCTATLVFILSIDYWCMGWCGAVRGGTKSEIFLVQILDRYLSLRQLNEGTSTEDRSKRSKRQSYHSTALPGHWSSCLLSIQLHWNHTLEQS